jgi:7-carboxy-7-deazaguanine synthase
VFNKHDFIWAEEQAAKVGKDCFLYLQPEWSKRHEITPLIVEYVKAKSSVDDFVTNPQVH